MSNDVDRLSTALADRYRIERELGAGGMATVYLAEDLKHKRMVAVKVLRPELAAVLGAERFLQEITTTANLQHPHILPLFDSGETDGFLYYVMPYIEGETLRDKLNRETQLSIDEAVKITTDIADALDYAHRNNVIHRDIKPENILLHDGRPMVADFGIALAVSAAAGGRMTETGLSLGTPHYMSPEQATAEKDLTNRSDIYSLGSVLYEMLAGSPPHVGSSAQQIIMKIVTEEAQPVTKVRKSVSPHVAAAVAKALEKLPADRFASAKAFADALANPSYASDTRAVSQARGAIQPLRALGLRAVAIVAVAALILGVVTTKLAWREHTTPPPTMRLMLDMLANQRPRYTAGPGPILTLAPDGAGLLYSGPGVGTRTQYWLRQWDQLQATRLPQSLDEGCCAAFSPSGDSVAYLTGPHTLHVVPLGGGLSAIVADSGLTSVTDDGGGLDWGTDGWIYVSGIAGLVRVSPRGGALETVATLDAERDDLRYLWPEVLPGARAAVLTVIPARNATDPERASIGVVDLSTGKIEILLQGIRAQYSSAGYLVFAKANGVLWAAPFDAGSLRLSGREVELSDTVAVTAGGTADFSLSPDGTLAYAKGVVQSFQAVWVDRNGESRRVAADLRDFTVQQPTLSPDGLHLVVSMAGVDGRSHLWVESLDGSPKSRLTFDGSTNYRPSWRPGTGTITFLSNREETPAALGSNLFEVRADGSGSLSKTEFYDDRGLGGLTWSPDGTWMVFRTDDQEAGNADILAIRPGVDTVPRAVVATPAEELSPAVSFDGRWIAYSSNESGRREVYVRPFPDAGSAQYQISTTGGINPAWSHNGRELFYLDAASNLISVPVTAGTTFQTGAPRVLFPAAQYASNPFSREYDITPDGQEFVMIRGESDAAVHVVVVFNFVEELKRRMAAP